MNTSSVCVCDSPAISSDQHEAGVDLLDAQYRPETKHRPLRCNKSVALSGRMSDFIPRALR
jgi:hypothetical protein